MRKNCFCCDYIIEVELFKFKNWHQPSISKLNIHCKTPNFIYAAVAIRNILDKPQDSLKRDSVFTDNTFDNPNVKK